MRRVRRAAWGLLGLSVGIPQVEAQAAPERVALAWVRAEGAERCASTAAIQAAVRARLGRDPFDPRAPVSAEGQVVRVEGAWRAWLVFRDADGVVLLRRELRDTADDCATLSAAVALSLSLALAPVAPPAPSAPTPADDAERAPPPVMDAPPIRTTPTPPRVASRTTIGAGAELLFGALPGVAPGALVRVESAWSPRVVAALRVAFQPERRTEAPDEGWAFGMTRASIGLCARAAPHARVEFVGCVQLSGGLVHGVSFGLRPVAPGNYGWASAGIEGRATVRLVGPLVASVSAAPQWAFARNRFVAEGREAPVYDQSAGALALEVSLGVAR